MLVTCPVGIQIRVGVANTVLERNTMLGCRVPFDDKGKNTIETGTLTRHYYQQQESKRNE